MSEGIIYWGIILYCFCISPISKMDDLEFEFRAERQYLIASGKTMQEITKIFDSKCKDKKCMVTICCNCSEILKVIKSDNCQVSHGICPDCAMKLYPQMKFWDNVKYKNLSEELKQKNETLKSL